jgi:phosphonate transport system substrate-binding protein
VQRTTVDLTKRVSSGAALKRPATGRVYRVGFDPRLDPYEEARIYAPLLAYLERSTGERFEIRFTKRGESLIDNLGTGTIDFAFLGGVSYVRAHEWYGARCLARGLNATGEDRYRAAIITRPQSAITQLGQLRGRSFAFGNESSTQGHLIPEAMLAAAGIGATELGKFTFHASHQACAEAVMTGAFDAGGIQDTLAKSLSANGLVKVIAWSEPYPTSGFVAGKSVGDAPAEKVRAALVAFRPKGGEARSLYHWDRTEMAGGFMVCGDHDYDTVAAQMRDFGMLERPVKP